jgi:hypothetical protein
MGGIVTSSGRIDNNGVPKNLANNNGQTARGLNDGVGDADGYVTGAENAQFVPRSQTLVGEADAYRALLDELCGE